MRKAQEVYTHLADLYRLAFWLTGHRELSVAMTLDVFDLLTDPFALLRASIRVQLRKAIIDKALNTQIAPDEAPMSSETDLPQTDSDEARLRDTMLRLDLFSRRIFVLTVLEGYSCEETSRLLRCDVDTVTEVRSVALSNLARGPASDATARGFTRMSVA
jgi:DNA-directed RNA polymerase specialized sigma24 family protein